ncbi:MAG TPA: bifunctional phosphoglucose/phosphomannose isomerase [Actinomycetota bacterium]|nr:bifunctional phosphoglucose/phosphomannose isomerase [Actinomycetota bacterium]
MIDLDDVGRLRELDAGDMLGAVASLPAQARTSYADGRALSPLPSLDGVAAVTYCGMGGSAVAGDVLRSLFRGRLGVPIEVNRGPELPGYCAPSTLVVVCSYSGGTAESLAAFEEALARGCRTMALTSGGELADRATVAGIPVVRVPEGLMPRAALGHLAFGLLGALEAAGLLPRLGADVDEAVEEMERLVADLGPDVPADRNAAKQVAVAMGERVPVIWGAEGFAATAANRWRTQWNENAKLPAFSSALPELDHNEVVGWSEGTGRSFAIVALRETDEAPDVAGRFDLSLDIARRAGAEPVEVRASGTSPLARLFSLVVLGDVASTYVGLGRGVDPSPIEAIARLKAALAGSA